MSVRELYTDEAPWSGIGVDITNADSVGRILQKAKLNWQVEKRPIQLVGANKKIKDLYALVRNKDEFVFGIVGPRYVPSQNSKVFQFFKKFAEGGGARIEAAGSLKNGRYVWALANLRTSFTLRGGDEVKGYILLASPHERGRSLIIRFVGIRDICMNTLSLAIREVETVFRKTHHSSFDNVSVDEAKEVLDLARKKMKEFETNARILQNIELQWKEVISLLGPIYQPNTDPHLLIKNFDTDAKKKLKTVMDIYEHAPGAQPGNGWGVLNAVTYYSDHIASREADRRMTNAWIGETANQKEKVFEALLEKAGIT